MKGSIMNNEEIGVLSDARALLEQQIDIHREIDLRSFGIRFHRKALDALIENQRTVAKLMAQLGRGGAWGIPAWADILILVDEGSTEDLEDAEEGLHEALQSDASDITEVLENIQLETKGVRFPISEEIGKIVRAFEDVLSKLREDKSSVGVQRNLVRATGRNLEPVRLETDDEAWQFIEDDRIRKKTIVCLGEARKAMEASAHMAALVLLRAVIEAMLVGGLLRIEDDARIDFSRRFLNQKKEAGEPIASWNIGQLLQVAMDNALIRPAINSLCREINRTRNDIHLYSCAGNSSYEASCNLGLFLISELKRSLNAETEKRLTKR
jgi:hypothetical protein